MSGTNADVTKSLLAFTTRDPAVRRQVLAPFDYVAVCRFPLDPASNDVSLFAALATGQPWPGLVPIPVSTATRLQLYRIDHAALK
ncbi:MULTISPECIES: hypothetical protein [Alphaproteobacteria]|uniref:Uncharacterized protein n=2 Tax=Alphaproteobacteria TaxID=28211 RepID=A0A512HED8_9HYPH|nr:MULTISPECIES: hypothetical protein [Alphaproteobacteria]GEO83821.1 hypothetical protein RNA01_07530 [Ciceribacter naphthalenivorans]GLR21301.1 hypothetical protein GCM10007920_10870 [Ciceribacter naphthalenivorans]GLT04157.1 hypothetical protein GCM10007926_10870 [Sphingomonas psychrolutea]